jgi:hypothetical protein
LIPPVNGHIAVKNLLLNFCRVSSGPLVAFLFGNIDIFPVVEQKAGNHYYFKIFFSAAYYEKFTIVKWYKHLIVNLDKGDKYHESEYLFTVRLKGLIGKC